MLRKLLKYDFKAVFRYWWIAALSSVALAFAGGWSISVFTSEKALPTAVIVLAILVAIIAVLGVFAFSLLTVIFVYSRFYKNLFTDEGYLTFTLPVKRSQLLNSKLITGIVAGSLTGFVLLIDVIIALCVGLPDIFFNAELIRSFIDEVALEIIRETGFYLVIYILEALLLFILVGIFSNLFIFCCITIGSIIAKKAKIITAIAIYYVANSVFTFVIQIFMLFGVDAVTGWIAGIEENLFCPIFALIMLCGILFIGTVCTMLYSLQYWMLDRKLNLA
ncbi:MAG: hypothetical protein IKV25_07895 [Clostridia bacterium]|nr:hypothetical protein [Clostridia bacterium]